VKRAWLAAVAVTVAFFASTTASAQDIRTRRIGVAWDNGVPRVSFNYRDLLTESKLEKLESGLPQTITLRVYAYAENRAEPLAVGGRTCRVVFDLWEEVYRVQIASADGDRVVRVRTREAVLERCLLVRREPIGRSRDYSSVRGRSIYFAALAELNPISPETVQNIRRWLARPGGHVEGNAFFGSFVSLFVNRRIGDAERTVRFRSPNARVP
jgi:hypothetical protein